MSKKTLGEWWGERNNTQKILLVGLLVFFVAFVVTEGGGQKDLTACECADIYNSPLNPNNIEYSAEEINSGSKMNDDVDAWVEAARGCALNYGDLTDVETELTKDARSIAQMSGFDKAISNAKKECK